VPTDQDAIEGHPASARPAKSTKGWVTRPSLIIRRTPGRFWPNEPNFLTTYQWLECNDRRSTAMRTKAWVSGEQPPHTAKVLAERTQFFDNISMAEKQPIVLCPAKSAKS